MNANIVKVANKVAATATKIGYKTGIIQKSPEIALVAGVVSICAGVVCACNATLNSEEILEKHKERIQDINDLSEEREHILETKTEADIENDEMLTDIVSYDKNKKVQDLIVCYVQTGRELIKKYIPSALLIGGGIGLIFVSHGILRGRYLAAMTAYDVLKEQYDKYRNRVINEYGKDVDYKFANNLREHEIKAIDTDGKEIKVKALVNDEPSRFSVFFSPETSSICRGIDNTYGDKYERNNVVFVNELNMTTLQALEDRANAVLSRQGYLFYYELLEMAGFYTEYIIGKNLLGISHKAGWVLKKNKDGIIETPGDGYIDLGFHGQNFLGKEEGVWLTPNFDGEIVDMVDGFLC